MPFPDSLGSPLCTGEVGLSSQCNILAACPAWSSQWVPTVVGVPGHRCGFRICNVSPARPMTSFFELTSPFRSKTLSSFGCISQPKESVLQFQFWKGNFLAWKVGRDVELWWCPFHNWDHLCYKLDCLSQSIHFFSLLFYFDLCSLSKRHSYYCAMERDTKSLNQSTIAATH